MARKAAHAPLNVFLNRRRVGRLTREASGAVAFEYDDSWLAFDRAIPVSLSMPLREERYAGAAVIAVFDNLLPDGADRRRRIAERVGAEGDDAFSLLSAIGRDCVGALQFLLEGAEPDSGEAAHSTPVSDAEISLRLRSLAAAPLGLGADDRDFRISIAGAQEKTALLKWHGEWRTPYGSTPTTHILKPQIGKLSNGIDMSRSVENEHFCMTLAKAFGLPVAETAVADFEGVRTLVVTRFDRHWRDSDAAARLPQEDFCQALGVPPTRKYQSEGGPGALAALDLLRASDEPDADRALFFKTQVFFWLIGATDGHAKNFSIHLGPRGSFRMTPLYDILSAQPAVDAGQIRRNQMKLAMSYGDSKHYVVSRIAARHFAETARRAGVPASTVQSALADLRENAVAAVLRTSEALPPDFPPDIAESISGALIKRAEVLSAYDLS
ncbi:MAG: type II toxin-antitoxin system HipA family toxin [Parvularculaceae bacterium]|nr:type II toxin-antitoxin system HipA family toxin [Parvularculaceae bacterium]